MLVTPVLQTHSGHSYSSPMATNALRGSHLDHTAVLHHVPMHFFVLRVILLLLHLGCVLGKHTQRWGAGSEACSWRGTSLPQHMCTCPHTQLLALPQSAHQRPSSPFPPTTEEGPRLSVEGQPESHSMRLREPPNPSPLPPHLPLKGACQQGLEPPSNPTFPADNLSYALLPPSHRLLTPPT